MKKIVVVDYGVGNLRSVAQALRAVAPEADVRISGVAGDIADADRIVLPGQGAMADCMTGLRASGVLDAVLRAAEVKPLLGVCIGEQMLFESSEEGHAQGLGLLPGKVVRFQLDGMLQEDGSLQGAANGLEPGPPVQPTCDVGRHPGQRVFLFRA